MSASEVAKTSSAEELRNRCTRHPPQLVTISANDVQPIDYVLTMTSSLDLDEIYQFAIQLGKDAGKLLQDAAQQRMNGGDQLEEIEKLNSVDIVTKTDEGERPYLLRAHFCI